MSERNNGRKQKTERRGGRIGWNRPRQGYKESYEYVDGEEEEEEEEEEEQEKEKESSREKRSKTKSRHIFDHFFDDFVPDFSHLDNSNGRPHVNRKEVEAGVWQFSGGKASLPSKSVLAKGAPIPEKKEWTSEIGLYLKNRFGGFEEYYFGIVDPGGMKKSEIGEVIGPGNGRRYFGTLRRCPVKNNGEESFFGFGIQGGKKKKKEVEEEDHHYKSIPNQCQLPNKVTREENVLDYFVPDPSYNDWDPVYKGSIVNVQQPIFFRDKSVFRRPEIMKNVLRVRKEIEECGDKAEYRHGARLHKILDGNWRDAQLYTPTELGYEYGIHFELRDLRNIVRWLYPRHDVFNAELIGREQIRRFDEFQYTPPGDEGEVSLKFVVVSTDELIIQEYEGVVCIMFREFDYDHYDAQQVRYLKGYNNTQVALHFKIGTGRRKRPVFGLVSVEKKILRDAKGAWEFKERIRKKREDEGGKRDTLLIDREPLHKWEYVTNVYQTKDWASILVGRAYQFHRDMFGDHVWRSKSQKEEEEEEEEDEGEEGD